MVDNYLKNNYLSAYNYLNYDFKYVLKPIKPEILCYGLKIIDRQAYIFKLFDKLLNYKKACLLENGIFEFTILYSISHNCLTAYLKEIYENKFYEIIENLEKDLYLYDKIMNDETFDVYGTAFLKNSEINPKKWKLILDKQIYREWKEKNVEFTDEYECIKCHNRKSKISQQQNRGADEPMTIFISCIVCKYTIKLDD
jgi:DNA-directed RNA polymerase subunit M/transcription elongation factor TFIIS